MARTRERERGRAGQALDWLLEESAPGVALGARLQLLGESPSSQRIARLRRRANEDPAAARLLDGAEKAIRAGNYAKYRGAYWTLLFLAELRADGRDPRAARLARHVLGCQLENGGFSAQDGPGAGKWEIVCLTANMLRALVSLGLGDEPGVERGYRRLAERILSCGGVPCVVVDEHSLLTQCTMTIPQTLRALAVAPARACGRELGELERLLVQRLLGVRVFRYVRPDARRFYTELLPRRMAGTTLRAFKQKYVAQHPEEALELAPKQGWLRFSFPHSYNPDLLEALLALSELGVPHDPALDEALDHVEAKRGGDGRWKLEGSLNGKMLAAIEKKGAPSKWITLNALTVLRHFGRIEV
jgi:hypothetical protein